MNAADLLAALHASIGTAYPASRSLSARPGRVSVGIVPVSVAYEPASCEPWPMSIEAELRVQSATADAKGAEDLAHHIPAVSDLVRRAGWNPQRWRAEADEGIPAWVLTATANGDDDQED